MKRFLTAFCLIFLAAQSAHSKSKVPLPEAKPAASVLALFGKPQISLNEGKTLKNLKLGQAIPVGALLRTGSGKLSLLMSDGSTVHLGINSEITLKAHNPEAEGGGTLFGLAKGIARFVVAKMQAG